MKDEYTEPEYPVSAELKVKGSRFIARIVPVLSQTDASDQITGLRRAEYDATHHCSAWRIGPEAEEFRFNDDGEPNGTAGMPILRQLEGSGLTNVLCVVTRYYGGTKLGTGGLVRAYGDAAALALAEVRPATRVRRETVTVTFDYADTSPAMHTINNHDTEIAQSIYGERTTLVVDVRLSQVEEFRAAFVEALGGRGEIR